MDMAARAVSLEGPRLSAELFSGAVRLTDTKGSTGISQALSESLSGLPEPASGYRQAMLLCISASEVADQQERLRILKEASDVALDAVRIMGERYAAGLSTPCMAVFGLGIMAPMILMSILPIMGLGGMFAEMPVDSGTMLVATLVLIPAAILCLAYWLRQSNPFLELSGGIRDMLCALPLLPAIPLYLAMMSLRTGAVEALMLSIAPSAVACLIMMFDGRRADHARARSEKGLRDCVFELGNALLGGDNFETVAVEALMLSIAPSAVACLITMFDGRRSDKAKARSEKGLRDCVFELGNALLGGENFETVAVEAVSSRIECRNVGTALRRELDLCRGDVRGAVRNAVGPISPEVSRTLCDIQRCSEKDTEDAGRLAIAVGRQFQNTSNIRNELGLKLKGMTDMMVGTAMLFAPMVLGMSASMLGPLSEISGYAGLEGTEVALAVYLVELCAIIAVLTSSLGDGDGIRGMVWRFCLSCPIALAVFWFCIGVQLRRC